jgi:quercetin dioxygenase-like cupin family protein
MRARLALASLALVAGIAVFAGTVLATPPSKVTPTEYGVGELQSFGTTGRIGAWKAAMRVTGTSDLHVLSNRIAPGGSFGWHSHPGPSFVIVKSGTATVYLGADPTCRPHRIRAGKGFVDKGLQTHLVRNEGRVDLVTLVVSFTPRGATRRIDEPRPGNCRRF